jgi:1-acyl-sn-glycerol-3-phosphate acyltransferase
VPNLWGKLLYYLSKGIVFAVAKLYFRLRIENQRNVPLRGPVMVASNHLSHLDPPLVGTAIPRLAQNMAKRELFTIKILDWYMRHIGTVIVNRSKGKQALLTAIEYLKQGACMIIFPEGTRSLTGQLGQGHSGAIVMALRTGCTVVPAAIIGSDQAMHKGSKGIRSHQITVRFGEGYKLAVVPEGEQIPRQVLERECYLLMERIAALLPENMRPSAEQKLAWYGERAVTGSSFSETNQA